MDESLDYTPKRSPVVTVQQMIDRIVRRDFPTLSVAHDRVHLSSVPAVVFVECTWGDGPDVYLSVKHTDARPNFGLMLNRAEARALARLLTHCADQAEDVENRLLLETLLCPPPPF